MVVVATVTGTAASVRFVGPSFRTLDASRNRNMDVFKLDQSLAAGLGGAPSADKLTADVSFGAGTTEEFNLSFFDDTTTDTAGSESHDTPIQGFGDESSSCTPMDVDHSPSAAFHDVHVQSPSSSSAYRQAVVAVAYGHSSIQQQSSVQQQSPVNSNSTPSSSTTTVTSPGQFPAKNILSTRNFYCNKQLIVKLTV